MTARSTALRLLLVAACLPAAILAAYWPGLSGGFVFDDQQNIIENDYVTGGASLDALLDAAQSGRAGPLGRPLSMASFAVDYARAGTRPMTYKITNLAIHCLNAWLVYALARLLLATPAFAPWSGDASRRHLIALVATLAWALHPINLTSVLYVVQRMTSLATLFMLVGTAFYLWQRTRLERGTGSVASLAAGVAACTALAASAKETGLLLPVAIAVCELTLFRHRPVRGGPAIEVLLAATVVLPALALAAWLWTQPEWLAQQYRHRPFALDQRLLTEFRVLWLYLGLWILPRPGAFALFHDDLAVSTTLLTPPTTLLSMVGLAGAVAVAARLRARQPLVAFALFWYLGAHSLESTFISLELVHEHRNYYALVGPTVALVAVLWHGAGRPALARGLRILACGWLVLGATVTYARAHQWSDPLTLAVAEVDYHPGSYRTQYELARSYHALYTRDGDPRQHALSRRHFEIAAALDRTQPLPYFALFRLASLAGQTYPPAWIEQLGHRLRHAPMHPNIVAGFRNLVECQVGKICTLTPDAIVALFGAVIGNLTVDPYTRAQLLTLLATWYANALGDLDSALHVMEQVVAEYPDEIDHRMNHIRFLIAAGRGALAASAIDAAGALIAARHRGLRGRTLRAELEALAAVNAARPGHGTD